MSDKKLSVCLDRLEVERAVNNGIVYLPLRRELSKALAAEEVEVIPVDSPNVLSVEEARLLVRARDELSCIGWTNADFDICAAASNRLSDWAAEETN